MAKKAKQSDSEDDDDVYLEVKQEVFGTANRQKNLAPQETRETPRPKTSTPNRYSEMEATPSTAKFSKETKAALKIVRKHAPSTPLFKTAVSMITEYVLAKKTDQPTSSLRRNTFGFIEEELSRKSTPDGKTSLVIEHVRAEVGCALARNLANVIENKSDLEKALSTVRSAAEARIPALAKASLLSDSGQAGMQNKRKRAASEAEVKQIKSKATKTDESSSAEDDAQSNKAGKDFDLDKFMTYRKREKAGIYAKRHFIDGRKLFEFHVQRLRSTSNKRCPLWSALTTEQKTAWQLLLAALHQGSKEPVGDQGKELLETQRAKHSGASAPVVDSPSSSSSSDDSASDDSESDDDTSDHASSAKDSAISLSSSQTKETSKAHETFRPVKRKGGWTEEENKVLLKGLHQSWSNERIQAELPPTSVRTLAAISTAKSIVKKRHSINPPPCRAKPSLALPASTSTASSSKRSWRPDQSSTPEPQSIVNQGSRIETPRSPITTSQKDQPGAVQLPMPQRQSVLDNEQRPDSASSGASYLICTPQHPSSVRWLVYTSVDRPSPTFIHFEHRPPRTDETRNLRYLMLPVETPECPIINPSAEDVTNACKLAFDKAAAFRSAQKLGDTLWTVSFDRSGTSLVPMRRLMETVVRFRDFRFSARWLSIRPPRTFVADIPQEGVTATSDIVAAIQSASRLWKSLPQLALHRPQASQSRKIVAQFPSNPGLVQFYVPVRMGSSQRWLHIRFEPLSLGLPCWHCEGSHEDGWCDKAEPLPYPER